MNPRSSGPPVVLWAATESAKLSRELRQIIENEDHLPMFSAASIWEVAIKVGPDRPDFGVDPVLLRRGLLDNGWEELPITGAHAAAVARLPPLHKDPFDRILAVQATHEGTTLFTADKQVAEYPGSIRLVAVP